MADGAKSSDGGFRRSLDDLHRRIAAAPPGEKLATIDQWVREKLRPDVPDDISHGALTVRDIFREAYQDFVQPARKKLVLIIHGIRDQGEWMEMAKVRLQSDHVVVQPIDFEDYDAIRFMAGIGIRGIIQRTLTKIRNAKANNEGAELVIIAHSFGTYVISRILKDNPDVRCSHAIFCGAVVRRRFRFDLVPYCPKIVNECGGRDIWPVVAQGFNLGWRYGASGVWGFRADGIEDRFHDSGHSDYLTPEFVDTYWKPYIHKDGFLAQSPFQGQRRVAPRGVTILSYGWWLLLIGIGLTVAILMASQILTGDRRWGAYMAATAWLAFIVFINRSVRRFRRTPIAAPPLTSSK